MNRPSTPFKVNKRMRKPCLAAVVAVLAVWATCYQVDEARHEQIETQRFTETEQIARLMEYRVSKAVGYADSYLRMIRSQYDGGPIDHALKGVVGSASADVNIIDGIAVFDTSGVVQTRLGTSIAPMFGDEAQSVLGFFEKNQEDGFFFSCPKADALQTATALHLSRPILGANGELKGFIQAAIGADALDINALNLNLETAADARIVGLDGRPRLVSPSALAVDDAPLRWPDVSSTSEPGTTILKNDAGRFYAERRVPGLPLAVQVSIPFEDISATHGAFHHLVYGLGWLATLAALLLLYVHNRTLNATESRILSEARFRDFTEASSDWMWEMDADLRFSYMSDQIEGIIGLPAKAFIGRSRGELIGEEVHWKAHAEILRRREPFRDFVYPFVNPNREERWVRVSGVPLFDENGAFTGYRGTGSDITVMIENERKLKVAHDTLEAAVEQRTEALRQEIAERELVEQELRRSEDLLRDFGAAAADWYWETDENHVFIYLSPEFNKRTGVPAENILGQVRDAKKLATAGDEAVRAHMATLAARKPFRDFVRRIKTADGPEIWISANGKPIFDANGTFKGYRGTSTDITDQRKDQERLRDLLSALERMPEAIAVLDHDNRFLFTNQAYRNFNNHIEDLIQPGGDYLSVLKSHATSGRVPQALGRESEWLSERIAQLRLPECTVESQRSEGRWHRRMEYALPSGGRAILVIDVTGEKKGQEALRMAKDDAVTANNAKSDFLSRMSHELRTPLNAILGFSQTLAMDPRYPLNERQTESVKLITSSGNHLLDLIGEVLELSQIEAGKLDLNIEPVDPTAVIAECIDIANGGANEKKVEIENNVNVGVTPKLMTDAIRLKQILLNLITNAVKYNRPGGRVTVDCSRSHPDVLRLSVTDTGAGIEAKYHDRIFEPFDRLGRTREDVDGTGIGLALSKQLADALGGVIGFDTVVGVGTTFWIELPIADSGRELDAELVEFSATNHEAMFGDQLRQYQFLYVEDNRINIQLMQSIMTDFENIDLTIAINAETGIEMANKIRPDLILMDIGLPGINGIDAVKVLKSQTETQDIPVIAVSAAAMPDDLARAKDTGFFDYLTKPLDIPKTLSVIESAISPRH